MIRSTIWQNCATIRKNHKFPIDEATPLVRHDEGTLRRHEGVYRSEGTHHCDEPKEQQTKILRARCDEGRAAKQYVQPISSIFEDLYKGGHIQGFGRWMREDQISPLGLEIISFEVENPPYGFSPLVLE